MKSKFLFFLCLISMNCFANIDSSYQRIKQLEEKINSTNDKVEQIKQGQLTYQIEKDLLKETYSNNYDRINTVITILLGIVGLFAFLGLKDINSIKKEYQGELENLRKVKTDFEIKSTNFETEKKKFELDIKDIIKQNEEQNNKIKVLELKEKIKKLLDDNQVYAALEYCTIGLEIAPNDISFLNSKAQISSRLNQFEETRNTLKKALEIEPDNLIITGNYVESLYFINEQSEAKTLIEKHKKYFTEKEDGKLLIFLEIFEKYYNQNEPDFEATAKTFLDLANPDTEKKYFKNWSLKDAQYFAHFQKDSRKKLILQNIFWFLDGLLTSRAVAERIGIELS